VTGVPSRAVRLMRAVVRVGMRRVYRLGGGVRLDTQG
jgi:hypothetical protein